jgi:hypothetical protein
MDELGERVRLTRAPTEIAVAVAAPFLRAAGRVLER